MSSKKIFYIRTRRELLKFIECSFNVKLMVSMYSLKKLNWLRCTYQSEECILICLLYQYVNVMFVHFLIQLDYGLMFILRDKREECMLIVTKGDSLIAELHFQDHTSCPTYKGNSKILSHKLGSNRSFFYAMLISSSYRIL